MLKKEIRAIFKSKRGLISSKIHEDLSVEIANQCLKLDIWNFTNYHIFLPIKKNKEINTKHIIQIIQGRDKNVILPKIESDLYIKNYLLTDSTLLITNSLGISEPQNGLQVNVSELDVIFLPLLAFDKFGNRVGYGKGYYDKMLSECSENSIKIGLSFFDSINEINDVSNSDMRMNYCVTPKRIYQF